MAEVEVAPLTDRLAEDEVQDLVAALEQVGAPAPPNADDTASKTIADGVDEDLVREFIDRLEALDVACDIYLPVEFEDVVEVGQYRVGSVQALLDALEEIKDDLEVEEEEALEVEAEDEEEDPSYELVYKRIRHLWKVFYEGAQVAIERKLPLHVRT